MAYRNLSELFREEPSEKSRANAVRHETISGNIVLKDVVMNYQSSQRPSLQIDNLIIQQGEKVAILGKIGSGKTTLLKLLSNLHTQTHGSIKLVVQNCPTSILTTLDDISGLFFNRRWYSLGHLRTTFYWETQTHQTKNDWVWQIDWRWWHSLWTTEGVWHSVDREGLTLSGGQRQMICIARAMISDPPLFMMDEPTSAMDTQTENTLLGKLKPWLSDRTLIVATHRGSLLK